MTNRLGIAVLLAVPTLSFAQGVPENCRAPMANFMELSAIPQLLHLPSDGPKIMGIVPTGNSHAREIAAIASTARFRFPGTTAMSTRTITSAHGSSRAAAMAAVTPLALQLPLTRQRPGAKLIR